jgi:asparagine synthase (glutamine-hydrolysing)
MSAQLKHRGPDGAGTFNDRNCSLGHQRLAIIDLSERGKQPMTGCDDKVWVTFNGEIYNWKELRHRLEEAGHVFFSNTDTEVIVHGFEEYGDKLCGMLDGDFAFALYDSLKKKILLARDRVGVKPLYYAFVKGRLAFASEIKALLAIPGIQRKVNRAVLDRYFTLRYPFGRETMFEGIFRLLPGEMLEYDCKNRRRTVRKFWTMAWQSEKKSAGVFAAQLRKALDSAVERQLMSDVPLGAYLSGGIDSASIVALMSRHTEDIKTFSVGFGTEDADELKYARVMSDHLGTDHREILVEQDMMRLLPDVIWHCDEPIADPAMLPVYALSREAKKDVTVVLTGDGGDELFAGYEQYKFLRLAHRAGKVPGLRTALKAGLAMIPPRMLNSVFRYAQALGPQGIQRAQQLLQAKTPLEQYLAITSIFSLDERAELMPDARQTAEKEVSKHFKGKDALQSATEFEFDVQLPENMLMKTDRMSMAHAVEARVPILDNGVLGIAGKIPFPLRLRGRTEKYIFRRAMAPLLPKATAQRKKQRFYVPIDRWLADAQPLIDRMLSPEMMRHKLFDRYAVQKIRDKYRTAPLFYARQLWTLLTFQLWYNQFIRGGRRAS